MSKIYTHGELVVKAAQYLRRTHALVLTEMSGGCGEEADAIGWGANGSSTIIECKASRSDFLSDKNKRFRRFSNEGMGAMRYYLANKGVIDVEELPQSWGLIEPSGRGLKVLRRSVIQEYNIRGEKISLISAIRRIGLNAPVGISVKAYTYYESKCTATLGVQEDKDIS